MRASALVLSLLLLGSAGCAKASTLHEEQPVSAGLGKYASASVETRFEGDAEKEASGFDGRLTERVIEQLKNGKVFAKVDKSAAGAGDLTIRMTITKASKGSSVNQRIGTMGDASVDVSVELVAAKESRPLGKFQVHADSSRSSRTSVNGVDPQTGSNPLNRAVDSAAEEIGGYLGGRSNADREAPFVVMCKTNVRASRQRSASATSSATSTRSFAGGERTSAGDEGDGSDGQS